MVVQNTLLSLRLESELASVLSRRAEHLRRDRGEYAISLIERGLLQDGAFDHDPDEKLRFQDREWLVQYAVDTAKQIGFRPDITVETFNRLERDDIWCERYRRFIGTSDIRAKGVALKSRINPRIGKRIKAAFGAASAARGDSYSISNGIIQTATKLVENIKA